MSKAQVFLVTGAIAVVGGVATSSLISSCDTVCSTESRASVMVHVVDESGDPITADSVTYMVADDPNPRSTATIEVEYAECADENCTEWVAGYETEGLFLVTAEVCGRTVQGRVNVELTEDGCHVETEHVYLEADTMNCERPRSIDLSQTELAIPKPPTGLDITAPEPQLCTREARPSVVARVMLGDGSAAKAVKPDAVYYQIDGDQLFSAMCLDEGCLQWAAGWEQTGSFSVYAIYDNNLLRGRAEVEMTEDGCHVDTQYVNMLAQPLQIGATTIDKGPFLTAKPRECTLEARPSVVVEVVDGDSEVAKPVQAKSVWYEIKEVKETTRGMCIHEPCGTWIVGIEQSGVFDIYADVCGEIISTQAVVEHAPGGCHVETEYVKLIAPIDACPK